RDFHVTGVQTCALPILSASPSTTTSEGAGRPEGGEGESRGSPVGRTVLGAALVAARLILLFLPLVLAVDKALPARTGRVVIPDRSEERRVGIGCRRRCT